MAEAKQTHPNDPSVDPDHHLWRNGRLWWVAFTVHLPGWQKDRVRLSLATDDELVAEMIDRVKKNNDQRQVSLHQPSAVR